MPPVQKTGGIFVSAGVCIVNVADYFNRKIRKSTWLMRKIQRQNW